MVREKICGIYCIENLINHKKYIGLSVNIYKRWGDHKYALNNQKHANPYLQRAWNKYGKENFKFWIVEACNQVNLHDKEIYYIELYNTTNENYGYNCSCGGETTSTREGTLEKRSITLSKRKVVQVDFDGNIVNIYRNANVAGETNGFNSRNIFSCCEKLYGRKTCNGYIWMFYDDYKTHGINLNDYEIAKNNKSVKQYNEYGALISTYESARIAEKETGISYKLISAVCNGSKKSAHGFIWRFANDSFAKYNTQNLNLVKVDQYDKNGVFMKTWNSKSEIKNTINVNVSSVLNGSSKSAGGFYWCKHGEEFSLPDYQREGRKLA